ncbi:MAG: hypothetical protein ACOH5I_13475 [Oligoflexus sp.]
MELAFVGKALCLLLLFGANISQANPFIESRDGKLWEGDDVFRFYATNSYRMLESSDVIDQNFSSMQNLGINALRFWGFVNGNVPQREDQFLVYNRNPNV